MHSCVTKKIKLKKTQQEGSRIRRASAAGRLSYCRTTSKARFAFP